MLTSSIPSLITVSHLRVSASGLRTPVKPRFLISHYRNNSVMRDKLIGKKWIYSERNTSQTECRPSPKEEQLNLEYFSFSIKKSVFMHI